jgi:hypothetical protein
MPLFILYDRNTSISIALFPILELDSIVGIATDYGLDDQEVGVPFPVGLRIFSSPRHPDRL